VRGSSVHRGFPGVFATLVVSLPILVIAVGNTAPTVTWWEHDGIPTSADPNENYVAEVRNPSSCGTGNMAHLAVRGVGTFVQGPDHNALYAPSYEADTTLPRGATFTGWHAGERELWIGPDASRQWQLGATVGLDAGLKPPDAIYVVSPWGVERWPRSECG
jgi:hypothetical protein